MSNRAIIRFLACASILAAGYCGDMGWSVSGFAWVLVAAFLTIWSLEETVF